MNNNDKIAITEAHEEREQAVMGFWVYLLSDTLIFGSLFAAYFALSGATSGGPRATDLYETGLVLKETLILLASSYAASLVFAFARHGSVSRTIMAMLLTFALGVSFLSLELSEFAKFISEGAGPDRSAFLSSYFALIGTHGLHIFFGCVWLITLIIQTRVFGITSAMLRRIWLFSLFWHFLDIVWILIFTFVYLFAFI